MGRPSPRIAAGQVEGVRLLGVGERDGGKRAVGAILLRDRCDGRQARRREHSRKPDACFDAIDGMFPDSFGRRVELFSRQPRDGWRAWGNQTDKFPPPSGDIFQEAAE